MTQGNGNIEYLQSLKPKCSTCGNIMYFEVETGMFICLDTDCEDN